MAKHRHLHLNVRKDMSRLQITQDLEAAFALGADTVGFCEMETAWHHVEFWRLCREHGYVGYLPDLGEKGSALALACRSSYGNIIFTKTVFCVVGAKKISPARYIARMRVDRHVDRHKVCVLETHQYSSGWTGPKVADALRKARWFIGMKVVTAVSRKATKYNDIALGAGDLNRPPYTWPKGKVLGPLMSLVGMRTATYAHTDHTHGGLTFDYTWLLSSKHRARFSAESTPPFNSDHDGILSVVEW